MRTRERVFAALAIAGATLGGVSLILLSIFDTARHEKAHRSFLLIFMVGVAISALFTVLEFRWLNKHYADSRRLHYSYIAKAIIVFVLVALSIGFGGSLDKRHEAAAVLEWIIAFGFTFYLLTFVFDLLIANQLSDESNQNLWSGRGMSQRRVRY